jgi:phosphoribosylpyrophosphate synthetase
VDKIVQLSVAPLFCKAITGIHKEDSISSLFDIQF